MEKMDKNANKEKKRGWGEWIAIVIGWLVCACLCLAMTIGLEAYPAAYDTFYPVALLVLFGNVFIFLFIGSRWAGQPGRLYNSVFRLCVGEGLMLAGIYALGRYAM